MCECLCVYVRACVYFVPHKASAKRLMLTSAGVLLLQLWLTTHIAAVIHTFQCPCPIIKPTDRQVP